MSVISFRFFADLESKCIDMTYCKIVDFEVKGEISDSEEHDLLEESPEQMKLDVTPEHNADLNLALLRLITNYIFL